MLINISLITVGGSIMPVVFNRAFKVVSTLSRRRALHLFTAVGEAGELSG